MHHRATLGAEDQVGQLLEPLGVTWALHIALLDAIVELGLPTPDIGQLRQVDNLFVQEVVRQLLDGPVPVARRGGLISGRLKRGVT
jgi:hypothetical protein